MWAIKGEGAAMPEPRAHPLFVRSLNPMLIADDERHLVDANAAACLLLRLPYEEVRRLTIDDLNPPDQRADIDAVWTKFVRGGGSLKGGQSVPRHLQMPDGMSIAVDISATPHFQPGRHLAIIFFPAAQALNERLDHAPPPADNLLTKREREVLALVALGHTGVQIAAQLFLSPATVQTHVTNILIKLGAKNRAHGIAIALRAGELDLVTE